MIYSIGQNIYNAATAEVKAFKAIPRTLGAGVVITGAIYGLSVAALAISSRVFAAVCGRIGFSSLATRIALPAILSNPWVIVAISVGVPCVRLLINSVKKHTRKPFMYKDPLHSYSKLGKEAIQTAREILNNYPHIEPYVWEGKHQPINQEIAYLANLYLVYGTKCKEVLQKNQNDPWKNKEVLTVHDDLIKISYALGCLTLDDLPDFVEDLKNKNTTRTFAEALTLQDSYQYRTFFRLPQLYHTIRGEISWIDSINNLGYKSNEISKEHADEFYKENTQQNSWRVLYNDYCDRITNYVSRNDLKKADTRHDNWTQKDELQDNGTMTFKGRNPDTTPT